MTWLSDLFQGRGTVYGRAGEVSGVSISVRLLLVFLEVVCFLGSESASRAMHRLCPNARPPLFPECTQPGSAALVITPSPAFLPVDSAALAGQRQRRVYCFSSSEGLHEALFEL